VNALAPAACRHCGTPVGPASGSYCCAGCEGAAALIDGLGLDAFYRRRSATPGAQRPDADAAPPALAAHARADGEDTHALDLLISGMSCGACAWLLEAALAAEPDVLRARVSFSSQRLSLRWRGPAGRADALAHLVAALGFRPAPWSAACLQAETDHEAKRLLRALGVAAFGALNVGIISLALWAGTDMDERTRFLLHWLAAAIALPVILYAGMPFLHSAATALRAGRTNMDVAVSIAILAIAPMSVSEAWRGGRFTWFDSATSLLVLLLAGRVLDRAARRRAGRAVAELLALQAGDVHLVQTDGSVRTLPVEAACPGDRVLVASGERLRLDGVLEAGQAVLDASATTGESGPRRFIAGEALPAASVNLGPAFTLRVTCAAADGSIARLAALMDGAQAARGRTAMLADRAARLYVPAVLCAAAGTFVLWWLGLGAPWQAALVNAVAVLIITCPCGLAIAVPAVQVVAVGALFRRGVLVRSGAALERLATVDHVVLDKTGTLTQGQPTLLPDPGRPAGVLCKAAGLARASRHPLARALVVACPAAVVPSGQVVELPGQGLKRGGERLGSAAYCGVAAADAPQGTTLWYQATPGVAAVPFHFAAALRPDAREAVTALRALGLEVELLSGDTPATTAAAASATGIAIWHAAASPETKAARIAALQAAGRRVLMVGDGINDAAALATAQASASLEDSTDLAQAVADLVLRGSRLAALPEAIAAARHAMHLSRQSLGFALAYNLIAVPAAVAGAVTPLVAALVMASSSLAVIGNALRAGRWGRPVTRAQQILG
jgi:Cu2+-exporting ATPase